MILGALLHLHHCIPLDRLHGLLAHYRCLPIVPLRGYFR